MTRTPHTSVWFLRAAGGAEGDPAGPGRRRSPLLALVPVATLALVLYAVALPYYVVSPGPTRDVGPLIRVRGVRVHPTRGHLLLTAVNLRHATAYDLVGAWLDPSTSALAERDVLPRGRTPGEEERVARAEMGTSQIDAAVVALTRYAGYPDRRRPGALVRDVYRDTPAEGRLFPGDLIVAIDGRRIDGTGDLGRVIRRAGAGKTLTFTVRGRPDGTVGVRLAPARLPGVDRPAIGVSVVQNFPFPVEITSGDIGGPSAGLMWALGLAELLTAADLANGRTVAGTGVIDPEGRVHPVGGVEEKVVAAERAGAKIFLTPAENAGAASSAAGAIDVVPVRSFAEAVEYLRRAA